MGTSLWAVGHAWSGYQPPSQAPFRCDHCKHYLGDKRPCVKVYQPIEAAGCCNLYKMGKGIDKQA